MFSMKASLSKIDRNLLQLLEINARKPISFYAKKLRVSRATIDFRLNSLIKRGIITGFHTVLNLTALGRLYCRVFIRYERATEQDEKEFIEYLKKLKGIGWIAISEGKWDLTFILMVDSIQELHSAYSRILRDHHSIIKEKELSILVQLHHFNHDYLYDIKDNISLKFSNKKSTLNIDETDMNILHYLSQDSRMSTLKIAENLKLAANTVKNRIKRLEKERIILAYRPSINISAIGFNHYNVFLELEQKSGDDLNKLISYLSSSPNVVYISEVLGSADLEFEVDLSSHHELNRFMRELRTRFPTVIRNYQTMLHLSEPLIKYLP